MSIKMYPSTFQTRWAPPSHIADIPLKREKAIRKNPLDDAPGSGAKVKFAPKPEQEDCSKIETDIYP
jgi:hypothetical protein